MLQPIQVYVISSILVCVTLLCGLIYSQQANELQTFVCMEGVPIGNGTHEFAKRCCIICFLVKARMSCFLRDSA